MPKARLLQRSILWLLALSYLLTACGKHFHKSADPDVKTDLFAQKFFNKEEFIGLEAIADKGEYFSLNYDLDKREGGLKSFSNCDDVENTSEQNIVPSQLIYLKTLGVNCKIAKHYKDAPPQAKKHWPSQLSEALVLDLPAIILPQLVSLDAVSRLGKIGDLEVYVEQQGPNNIRLVVHGLDIHLIQLARGDFTQDGDEDLMLRMDWSVMEAFGRGVDWVMLSREQENGEIKVEASSRNNN